MVRCNDEREPVLVDVNPLFDPDIGVGALVIILDPNHSSSFKLDGLNLLFRLTSAELEVCRHLSEGLTNREIADIRGTSPATVKAQVQSIFDKTGCANRTSVLRSIFKVNPPINR